MDQNCTKKTNIGQFAKQTLVFQPQHTTQVPCNSTNCLQTVPAGCRSKYQQKGKYNDVSCTTVVNVIFAQNNLVTKTFCSTIELNDTLSLYSWCNHKDLKVTYKQNKFAVAPETSDPDYVHICDSSFMNNQTLWSSMVSFARFWKRWKFHEAFKTCSSLSGDLRTLRCLRELNFWATQTGWHL